MFVNKRRLSAFAAAAIAAVALLTSANPAMASFDPIGTEPTGPYAQPVDAAVPKRGCTTTVASPTAPPANVTAVQFIYAWHEGNGNNYATSFERIAKIADRIDWSIDNSSNYDQHVNFSCRSGFDTGTYSGYAQALVVPVKIENPILNGETGHGEMVPDLIASGYDDPNRFYVVFEDFDGTGAAHCETNLLPNRTCYAFADEWDSGTGGHELVHLLDADHTYADETRRLSFTDLMSTQWNDWHLDQNFNSYYDPSELGARFEALAYPETRLINVATHPVLTVPVCCDIGYSNDLLTAQERTIESVAPWGYPAGFTVAGGGWMQVTPPGPDNATSARYFDGRRSLTMNVDAWSEGTVSVTRKVPVTAAARYQFYAYLATATAGNVRLRLTWYNSAGTLISDSTGPVIALPQGWREYAHQAVAPAGAASVMVRVVSPAGQTFAYTVDSLQLMKCDNGVTPDGCRAVDPDYT